LKIFAWLEETFAGTRKGIEDVFVSMVPQAATLIVGLLTSVLIARGLGPEGMGKYALILSVSGLALGLSDIGIGQTAIRFASKAISLGEKENQFAVLRWAFRLRMLLVFIITAIVFVLAPIIAGRIWHDESLTFLVRINLLAAIFGAIASMPMIYFLSLKRFRMNALVSVMQTLILFIGILIIASQSNWSIEWVIIVNLIAVGLGAIVFFLLVPRSVFFSAGGFPKKFKFNIRKIWEAPIQNTTVSQSLDSSSVNSFAAYMVLSTVFVMLTLNADVWLMGVFLDKNQIGLYSVGARFTLPLVMVLNGLNTALWPRASALKSTEETKDMLKKVFKICLIVSLFGVIYALTVPLLAPWLFGSAYEGSILVGQLLSMRYVIAILICPIGVIGYSFGLVRIYWLINILQLIVVVGINVLLLPQIGMIGSALALIANDMVGFIIIGAMIWRRINNSSDLTNCRGI